MTVAERQIAIATPTIVKTQIYNVVSFLEKMPQFDFVCGQVAAHRPSSNPIVVLRLQHNKKDNLALFSRSGGISKAMKVNCSAWSGLNYPPTRIKPLPRDFIQQGGCILFEPRDGRCVLVISPNRLEDFGYRSIETYKHVRYASFKDLGEVHPRTDRPKVRGSFTEKAQDGPPGLIVEHCGIPNGAGLSAIYDDALYRDVLLTDVVQHHPHRDGPV